MYFDQLLGAARQVHVVYLAQLLGTVLFIHFISNHNIETRSLLVLIGWGRFEENLVDKNCKFRLRQDVNLDG